MWEVGMMSYVPDEARSRARLFAETVGVEPPERMVDDDGAPAPEFLAFCRDNGASLDFILLGDLRPLFFAAFKGACRER